MADTYRSAATELFHSTEVRQLFPEEHGRIISVTTDTPIAQVFKVLCPPPPTQLSGPHPLQLLEELDFILCI